MPTTLPRIVERVETRWGMPLPDLLRDFAAQGMPQHKTAQALGIYRDTLRKLLHQFGLRDLFRPYTPPQGGTKAWITKVEHEYGQPIDAVLRQESSGARVTGMSMRQLATEFGVPPHRVRILCGILGIRWPTQHNRRDEA